jgi:hypothetical protein
MQETSTVPALQRYVNDHERDGKVRGCARECKLYSARIEDAYWASNLLLPQQV